MHTLGWQRIEVGRQGCHQGFAFTGAHLSDAPAVQRHATDQLHVEVPHAEHATRCLADDRKRFGQQLVECGAGSETGTELLGLGLQGLVAERLQRGLEGRRGAHFTRHGLQQSLVAAAENTGEEIQHRVMDLAAKTAILRFDDRRVEWFNGERQRSM